MTLSLVVSKTEPPHPERLPASRRQVSVSLGRRPPAQAVAEFARMLALLVTARVPLADALDTAAEQNRDARIRAAGADAGRALQAGTPLGDALAAPKQVFDPFLVHLVRAGELGGGLDRLLLRAADHLEKSADLQRTVRLALVYPALIVTVATGAVAFLLAVVVPTFADLFASFGQDLPGPTRAVLWGSQTLRTAAPFLPVALAVLVFGSRRALASPPLRRQLDTLLLRLPLVGSLLTRSLIAQFCRTVSTLLASGVGLVDALQTAEDALPNARMRRSITGLREAVSAGKPLAESARSDDVLPRLVSQLLAVGEETAELDTALAHLADYYDAEVDAGVGVVTTLMEPVLIVVVGAAVGFILVALYLPMFDLSSVIR